MTLQREGKAPPRHPLAPYSGSQDPEVPTTPPQEFASGDQGEIWTDSHPTPQISFVHLKVPLLWHHPPPRFYTQVPIVTLSVCPDPGLFNPGWTHRFPSQSAQCVGGEPISDDIMQIDTCQNASHNPEGHTRMFHHICSTSKSKFYDAKEFVPSPVW